MTCTEPATGSFYFIPLRVQCGSSSWTVRVHTGTRSCTEQPSLPKILQFCQVPCSGPVLALVVPRTGWFAIKSQEWIATGAVELMVMFIFQNLALRASCDQEIIVRSLMHARGSCCVGPIFESFLIATSP